MYCGAKDPPPNGMRRATLKECIAKKQIRYYGVKMMDPELLKKINSEANKLTYMGEFMKYNKMINRGKKLLNDIKTVKLIIEKSPLTVKEEKRYNKKLYTLLKRRDVLVDKLKKQKELLEQLKDTNK